MGQRQQAWRKLTRADLASFDDIATRVILYAMAHGGVGKISRKNHAILRSPDGRTTMSVPNNGTKSQQTLEINVRKLFPPREDETSPVEYEIVDPRPEDLTNPTLECPLEDCEATFVTEGARYAHCHDKHHVCRHPGCQEVFKKPQGESLHYRIVHEGFRPGGRKREGDQMEEIETVAADVVAAPPDEMIAAAELLTRWVIQERGELERRITLLEAQLEDALNAEEANKKRAEDAEQALAKIKAALGVS